MTRLDNPMSFERLGKRTCPSCVSSTPSKIPYGGFSPVRLQTGIQPQPSSEATSSGLYAARSPGPCCGVASFEAGRPSPVTSSRSPGQSGPEALGSPAGYVVPPGHRLLWPHPSLSASPADLSISTAGLCLRPRPRGSPLYSACPSLRAASLTPADPSAASGCCFADRHSLRFSRGCVTRLQSSLYAAARSFAGPSPTRAFTFELSPRGSPHRSVEYNYAGKQPIPAAGLTPAGHAALWAAVDEHR
jgi:hypothetical protein